MLGDFSCRVILSLCGYVFPAYKCFKAIEQKKADLVRQWCIYWFTLALFTTAEKLLDLLVFWVPLYYEAKVLFVIWLWHPKTEGAMYLYTHTVQPLLAANEATIDATLEETKVWFVDAVSGYFNKLIAFVQSKAHVAVAQLKDLQNKGQHQQQHSGDSYNMNWPNPKNAAQAAMNAFSMPKAD